MKKLYNTKHEIVKDLGKFFENCNCISTPLKKIIPHIIFGMASAESVNTPDIVRKIKSFFPDILFDSLNRRLERLYNNNNFKPYELYDFLISLVISKYSFKNSNVYIAFDHMYCKDNYTIFLLSLKIGRQGIPIWYRCFKGTDSPDAFSSKLFNEGITYVSNLFKSKKCNLVFLADRWFPQIPILKHINELNHTFFVRAKNSSIINIPDYEYNDMIHTIGDIEPMLTKPKYFENVEITNQAFKVNLAISPKEKHEEALYIITNGNAKDALKRYGYRFGAIETIFKSQKTGGLYLEDTHIRNIHAFESMYTFACITLLWLTILGADYSKNYTSMSKVCKIKISKPNKCAFKRVMSLFNTGLTLFNLLLESHIPKQIKCNFCLYDI